MIHYQLRCDAGHEFDGWFQDSAGFDKLAKAGLVECTHCGGTEVTRALMAPAIAKGRAAPPAVPEATAAPAAAPVAIPAPMSADAQPMAAGTIPPKLVALLQRVRAEVEKNCDYVGRDFAEEARRLHRGESERRGIYGEATDAEAEALADEGIDVARLPWVPRADG
jgi:hypothetical protein